MANNLYRKQKRQYSTDNGVTWKDVTPPVYQVGELIEENSDCSTDTGSIQYRWFTYDIDDQYTCDTESHTKYNLEVLQYSYDGQIWQNTTETRRGSQTETNSCDCGYTEYKWNLIEGRYTCGTEDFSKYGVEVYQIGCGNNWTNVEPYQERPTEEPIECYSLDCGMSSNEIVLTIEGVDSDAIYKKIGFSFLTPDAEDFFNCTFPSYGNDSECWDVSQIDDNTFRMNLNETTFPCNIVGLNPISHTNMAGCNTTAISIKSIEKWIDTTYFKSFSHWLFYCDTVESINMEHIKTDNAVSLSYMFYRCGGLTELDLSHFNTSNVTDMSWMFNGCESLTELDLSNFDTSNVANMMGMFQNCTSLRTLNLSGWDFSKIYNEYTSCNNTYNGTMNYMFAGLQDCEINLQDIKYDINTISHRGNIIESNGIVNVFSGCTNVTLDMRGLDSTIVGCFELMISSNDVKIITDATFNDGSNVLEFYTTNYDDGEIRINGQTVSIDNYFITTASAPTLVSIDMNTNYNPLNSLGGLSIIDGFVNFPDTSNLTTLSEMFTYMSKVVNFPKGLFNNISNVTSAYKMFYTCIHITEVDMSDLSAPNLTTTERMFEECGNLEYVNLSGWNTTSLTDIGGMFYGCNSLKTIDLSGWDFSNLDIDNFSASVFYGCNSLEEIILNDVSCDSYNKFMDVLLYEGAFTPNLKITTNIVTDNCEPFEGFSADIFVVTKSNPNSKSVMINNTLYNLNSYGRAMWLNIEDTDITEITSLRYFNGNLSRYYGSIINLNIDTSNVTDMGYMFTNSSGITSLDLSHFDTSKVTDMSYMFQNCSGLTELDLNGWNTSAVTNMSSMFEGCSDITSFDLSHFDTSSVTNMSSMFEYCRNLTSLDVSSFDTSAVTNMYQMFYGCESLTLNINGWNASNVTDMREMFYNCKDVNLSGWNLSNVTNMTRMFSKCKNVNLEDWDFSNINSSTYIFENSENIKLNECIFNDSMKFMFKYNTNLTTVEINNSDITNVTDMKSMFQNCTNLTNINLSGCNTSNVTDMSYMFSSCYTLESINLNGWDMTNAINTGMFENCSALTTIYCYGCNQATIDKLNSVKPSNCTLVY